MPNIIVDVHIANALKEYMEYNDLTLRDVGKLCGVSSPAVMKWKGVGHSIRENAWARLFPLIRSRLPESMIGVDQSGREYYRSIVAENPMRCDCEFVPMFTVEQMLGFFPTLDTPKKYGTKIRAKNVPFVSKNAKKLFTDVFCMSIDEALSCPLLPAGARVFSSARLNDYDNSTMSLAMIDGRIEIVRCVHGDEFITFSRLQDGKKLIEGDASSLASRIKWIFPVLYYEVDTYQTA